MHMQLVDQLDGDTADFQKMVRDSKAVYTVCAAGTSSASAGLKNKMNGRALTQFSFQFQFENVYKSYSTINDLKG